MRESQKTSLSVCIVVYNSTQNELRSVISSLVQAVRELQKTKPQSQVEISLVDNSELSNWNLEIFDESSSDFSELKITLRLLRGHGNIGFGRGHNLVISKLESRYHLILNPDVILEENCLAEGIRYLELHPQTAIASPYATGHNGKKQHLCKTYPALFTFLVRGLVPSALKPLFENRLSKFEMRHLSESEPTPGIPIVSGCFMLGRTELLQKIQGFDENYFLYFEDFDMCLRIGKLADIAYLPQMRIKHAGGHAAKKGGKHWMMFLQSARCFFSTHGWRFFNQS